MSTNPNLIYYDHLCFVLSLVCLYICVCECLLPNNNHRKKYQKNTNCRSAFEPGASGLSYYCASICVRSCCNWRASSVDSKPKKKRKKAKGSSRASACRLPYYCAPLVCVSEVIGLLAVWRHNKPKTKKPKTRNKGNKAGLSPNTLPEEYLGHNLDEHCLEDTGVTWCLSYIRGGTIPWVLSFLLVGRLDCWDLHASPQTMSLWTILTP